MSHPLYKKVHALSRGAALLNSVQSLLDWDQETYMPKEAIEMRSEQAEMLAHLVHRARTSKAFAKALSTLIDLETGEIGDDRLTPSQVAAAREWRRDYIRSVKLPSAFVKKYAKTTSTASHIWKTAKEHNDFKSFAPHLEKVVQLSRKKADILGFKEHPYDALLDLYEPEMTTAYLTPLFTELKLPLTQLLKEIMSRSAVREDFLFRHCPKWKQVDFSHLLLRKMGFHAHSSRLDLSGHPFCSGLGPKDTRMTTRINPDDVLSNIGAVLHEGGHGLYHMGLKPELFGSPLGEQSSLGIDESQSRWWETLIGQSLPFWTHFFPLLQKEFPEAFGDISLETFYQGVNRVKPGLIRIDADEVTYNLHILIRFEIEKGLIEGTYKVKDIPDLWNEKMREDLGVSPSHDGEGCLQDIHWSLGYIGYFPTYTLGNLNAAQFFTAFEKTHTDWREQVARGSLDFIRDWLRENIHQHGREYTPQELCQRITRSPLSAAPYITYLQEKYAAIYKTKP
ncbi:MAG: carboxypeptidase M32 [Verrucomicrobia bacterium]|nr:carboxypeptidase M32 [Verrucomicrobiota bacterium]